MSQLAVWSPADRRELRTVELSADLVVVGGGMAGTCAAVTAARHGARVVLIQDRPVLGGNASSEVRLWVQSANSHMKANNRWAREGGVIDEILVENTFRNTDGNAVLFDTVLLDKVRNEEAIALLLNTVVFDADKADGRITGVTAFCSQNETMYRVSAPLFCDASGDGVLGYIAGAPFRVGAEVKSEFDEGFAPTEEYGSLLPHSLFFYTKDVGQPVRFVAPSYALEDVTRLARYRKFSANQHGAQLWWLDHGGRLDTIYDADRIKWELWEIVYGIWNHIKNSGQFPEAESLTLEWVGLVSGKRESRRFEGRYMLRQRDIIDRVEHPDGVAFGGWAIDLHPSDGVFSEHPAANLLWPRGTYQIPYRCMLTPSVPNLFLAGRIISASHVAFASTRVMATCAHMAQAVGVAAAICSREGLDPEALLSGERLTAFRVELLRTGQHIPGVPLDDPEDLARWATLRASSEFELGELPADGPLAALDTSRAQLLPVPAGKLPSVTFTLDVAVETTLRVEARTGDRADDYTPDVVLAAREILLQPGDGQSVTVEFDAAIEEARYVFFCLMENENVAVRTSAELVTGLMSVRYLKTQEPDEEIGRPRIEFWCPERRPDGHNLALRIQPPLRPFGVENLRNGYVRPTARPNAWVAAPDDASPTVHLQWPEPRRIRRVDLSFDTDFDHAMESVLVSHPEPVMPFCVQSYSLRAGGALCLEVTDNHQTRNTHTFEPPLETDSLSLEIDPTRVAALPAAFEIRCYE